jgi:hypothetical protein
MLWMSDFRNSINDIFFCRRPSIFVGQVADENTVHCRRKYLPIFVGYRGRRKYCVIFVGSHGRRKYVYFRRQPTKISLFSSTLFRRPIFVGGPTKIAIFIGIWPIFVGFWPTKIAYFPVV